MFEVGYKFILPNLYTSKYGCFPTQDETDWSCLLSAASDMWTMGSSPSRDIDKGNSHYTAGNYDKALASYSRALLTQGRKDEDKAALHLNKADCFLNLEKYEEVIQEANLCEF